MRFLFLSLLFIGKFGITQTVLPPKKTTDLSELQRWNLDKYVWSHTHYKTSNTDKPVIDFNALDNWLSFGDPNFNGLSISPNGKYFAYTIDRGNRWGYTNLDTLVLQSTTSSWRKTFTKVQPGFFSANDKQYIFLSGKTLYVISLGGENADSVNGVHSYKMSTNGEWIAISKDKMAVTLQNLRTRIETKFPDVKTFDFDKSGKWFYYESFGEHTNSPKELGVYNLNTGKRNSFLLIDSYLFDEKGRVLVVKKTELLVSNEKQTRLDYINLTEGSIKTLWCSNESK